MKRKIDPGLMADLFRELAYAYGQGFMAQFADLPISNARERWGHALLRVTEELDVDRLMTYLLRTTNRPPNLADVIQAAESIERRVAL